MCGIFACVFPDNVDVVGKILCYGLIGLQHRGQEAAGIAIARNNNILVEKDFGMVNQVFSDERVANLEQSTAGIGHVRYSTFGRHNNASFIQPYVSEKHRFAIAFNGTIAQPFEILGRHRPDTEPSDVMMIMDFLEARMEEQNYSIEESIVLFSLVCSGAFSMTVLTSDGTLYVLRDMYGYRPLQYATIEHDKQVGYIISSEDCAFQIFKYSKPTIVAPGTVLKFHNVDGRIQMDTLRIGQDPLRYKQLCAFELIYFSRPDSHFDGIGINDFRERLGARLFQEIAAELDPEIGMTEYNVIGVPDSSTQTAIGFCNASGARFTMGLNKNRYIHRTFIQPTQAMRQNMVQMKLNTIPEKIRDKRIILIDDSLIRGTTMNQIVKLIRDACPKEIVVLIACPPVRYSCYFGMDFKQPSEMIANRVCDPDQDPTESIRKEIGADKLYFLSLEGLQSCLGTPAKYCTACWTGDYNRDIESLV